MDFLTVTLFALVGAAAQFVDGLLGMGFGITSASLLTVLGYSAVAASAGTHAAKVGTTLVSGVSHWREGNVDWRVLITVGVPGAIGAFIGAVVLTSIALDGARIWMAAILFLLGLTIIARFGYDKSLFPAMKLRTRNLWPIGLFGGFVDATGGGGWGPVATPSLMTVTKHKPHRIVGTVSASEFLVAASASIGFLFGAGEAGVPWLAVLGLVIGGVITAPIAARLAKKAPTAPLGVAVGGMVLIANTAVIASVLAISGAISAAIVAVELVITIAIVIQVVKRNPAPT
ncbi:sulfite exporter TauE/SafE family protein [Actinomycetota bacterium]|nr:sulfite exporter TauE/SafE family protein [Actinomycetota bacterium]